MNKPRLTIKVITLLMAYLVVILPLYTSSAFSVNSSITSLYVGEDISSLGDFGKVTKISAAELVSESIKIPLLSAGLRNMEVYGRDNIDGYLREEDQLTIKVSASIDGEAVNANQVRLNANLNFSSCAAGIDGYDCTLVWPSNGTWFFSRSTDFFVNLYSNSSILLTRLVYQII